MIIVWKGIGAFLVPAAVVLTYITGTNLAESIGSASMWPMAVAGILFAVLLWIAGKKINGPTGEVKVNKRNGQEKPVMGHNASIFFVKIQYWAIPLLLISLLFFAIPNN